MRSQLEREVRIIMLIGVSLLALACWLDKSHPTHNEKDTMAYKLKYVRLRAIHEEEWQRMQRSKPATETDSLEIVWQSVHGTMPYD